MKRLGKGLRSLAAATVLVGMTLAATGAAAQETLRVGYNQWIGSAGMFVAMATGLFEKHGVSVEFTEFAGPGDGVTAVLAGQLDGVLTTTDNVILLADKAGPGKMVQVYFTDTSAGADAIIARKEYNSVADLKGKTVAATVGQVNHLLLIKALHASGLAESDVKLVNMDAEVAGAAFVAGNLDAAVTWEPWLSKGRESGGNIVFSSADAPNLILDTFAVNAGLAKAKPEAVKAFIAAVDEGTRLVVEKPEQALPILAHQLGTSSEEAAGMLAGVKLYGIEENRKLFASGDLVKAAQEVADFLESRMIIGEHQDVAPLFDSSYVDGAM